MARVPDFFIVGAPKCGTSALSEYLRRHPGVFFSTPKEPFFYSSDYAHRRRVERLDDYLALFQGVPEGSLIGEGSTWYLRSELAIPRILEDNPDALFIVMLRNPIDMVRSLHAHMLRNLEEEEEDFARAWTLQDLRAQGRNIPQYCPDAKLLQYNRVAAYGEQLERLYRIVPKERVLVHIFEEFFADAAAGYRLTLHFLGLTDDRQARFEAINSRHDYRSRRLQCLLTTFGVHAKAYPRIKGIVNGLGLHPGRWLTRGNIKQAYVQKTSEELERQLAHALEPQILHLERIIGRDLSRYWRMPARHLARFSI